MKERTGDYFLDQSEVYNLVGDVCGAIDSVANGLVSPARLDNNLEPSNVVDGLFAIADAIGALARAVESKK